MASSAGASWPLRRTSARTPSVIAVALDPVLVEILRRRGRIGQGQIDGCPVSMQVTLQQLALSPESEAHRVEVMPQNCVFWQEFETVSLDFDLAAVVKHETELILVDPGDGACWLMTDAMRQTKRRTARLF